MNESNTQSDQKNLEPLRKLLRGELSSVETYNQVLEKVQDEPEAEELKQIWREHQEAVDTLTKHVRSHGGTPDTSSGPWGTFAQAVTASAKIFGETAALKALKEGEEHGIKEYEEALENKELDSECREVISSSLLPRQRRHIEVLDRLMTH